MGTRTRRATVHFNAAFRLADLDEELPAGSYETETDEELLEGISFSAYRRVLTVLHLQSEPGRPGVRRTVMIQPGDLDVALARDQSCTAVTASRA